MAQKKVKNINVNTQPLDQVGKIRMQTRGKDSIKFGEMEELFKYVKKKRKLEKSKMNTKFK